MTYYNTSSRASGNSPFGSILGIIMGVLFLIGLFYIAQFIFRILYFLSPVFIIAALIMDHKVVTGYGKWLWQQLRNNPLSGVLYTLLTILGFPLVSLFLLGKAALKKKVREAQQEAEQQRQGEFADFEELDSEPLNLDRLERQAPPRRDTNYDNFFDRQN